MDLKKKLNEHQSSNRKGDDYQSDVKEMISNNETKETADEGEYANEKNSDYNCE